MAAVAAFYLCCLDGIKAAVKSGLDLAALEKEISKKAGEESFYLEKDRQYRTEEDVFEDFTPEERNKLFGAPPATVWENFQAFDKYPEKMATLTAGNVFKREYLESFKQGALIRWKTEILTRLLNDNYDLVVKTKKLHNSDTCTDSDLAMWRKIQNLRVKLAKDSLDSMSLFTAMRTALKDDDYDKASALQLEIADAVAELKELYRTYQQNMID